MKRILIVLLAFPALLLAQPNSFSSRGPGGGGALFSPSINPANPSEYFISCDMSELFHTTDGGQSYSQVHFSEFAGGHNSKVAFTNVPGKIYAINYLTEVGIPALSTDNGLTWSNLAGNPDDFEDVYSLRVDYQNPDRIVISQYGAVYFSNDGGATFSNIHAALDMGTGVVVGGVFFDGDNIIVGTNDGVLVSSDAGTGWAMAGIPGIPANEVIWSFCAAKSGNVTRLFCLTADPGDVYVGLQGSDYWGFWKGVYSSDFGVSNWVSRSNGLNPNADYPMFVGCASNELATVWLAGSNAAGEPDLIKSTDAGLTWVHTFTTTNNANISTGWSGQGGDRGWSYGECPFGFDVAAFSANHVVFGDYGFAHRSTDGGGSWKQAYVLPADENPAGAATPQHQSYHSVGLENTTCWQVHWANANTMWACYSDIRGIRSTDAGDSWSFNYTGHSANSSYRVAQGSNGTLYAATSNIHDMYQSTRLADAQLDANDANGKLIYSQDAGLTWQNLHTFGHPVFWVALDPNNPERAYASVIHYAAGSGVGGVYRCDNLSALSASTWTLLPAPPRTEKHPASLLVLDDGTLLATYSGRRNSSGAFTPSSGTFSYSPGNNAWTDISDPGMHYWTKDLVLDPTDASQNTLYVGVFSGWGGPPNGLGGLYRSTNRGQSWTRITGTTLDRVTSCTFNPQNPQELYVTTERQGLWLSQDIQAASPSFSLVQQYPFRQPERVFFNPYDPDQIWVSSFGNGMKVGSLGPTGIPDFATSQIQVYPNPGSGDFKLKLPHGLDGGKLLVMDLHGKVVYASEFQGNETRFELHGLPKGMYLLRMGDWNAKLILE